MTKELIVLGQWEKAKRAIAECKTLDEVKKIRDKAEALRAYAKQAKESLEVQNNVAEIKIRCERKIGEFSKELPLGNKWSSSHDGKLITLKDAGIKHFERYESIANLPEKDFEKHIQEVKKSNEELTTVGIIKLARFLELKERNDNLKVEPLPRGIFNVIYADPAWEYSNSGFEMSAEKKYPTMSIEKLKELEVINLGAENSIMFMWATNPLLKDAIGVMESWGFEYKTNFVWIKKKHTAGFYVFGQHELLLIGVKGSMLPTGDKPKSIIQGDNSIHSKKPEIVYSIIESMFPNMKYVELFARNKRKNWESWGNETKKYEK